MSVVVEQRAPVAAPEPAKPAGERLYALDLLRFCAALAVVAFHLLADIDTRGAWGEPTRELFGSAAVDASWYGWMGVELFFVISGFVICMSSWGRSVSAFAVSRITRLMPAYVFAVLVTAAVLTLWPLPGGRPEPTHVLVNLTMLQRFVDIPDIGIVYWTLFVELKFYALFAVVVYFGLTYRRVVLFCVMWTVAAMMGQLADFRLLIVATEPLYVHYFVAGITLYLIRRFGPTLLLWGLLGTSVILSVVSLHERVAWHNRARTVMSFEIALPVMLCFFAVMTAVALGRLSWLRWRGLVVVGALTYPLYLLHMQLNLVAVTRLHGTVPAPLLLGGAVAGLLLLAWLTHRLLERPLARVLRRELAESFARIRAADGAKSRE